MRVSIRKKQRIHGNAIESAFVQCETLWKEMVLEDIVEQMGIKSNKNVKIKIEVDRNPPPGFQTEEKLLLRPFSFYVKCFDLPSLFAGKMHALIFRKWKDRVKGRDWYDMEWYIRKGVPLNLSHFLQRAKDTGDWEKPTIAHEEFMELLHEKISATSIENVMADIRPFIKNSQRLDIWSAPYFLDLTTLLKIQS